MLGHMAAASSWTSAWPSRTGASRPDHRAADAPQMANTDRRFRAPRGRIRRRSAPRACRQVWPFVVAGQKLPRAPRPPRPTRQQGLGDPARCACTGCSMPSRIVLRIRTVHNQDRSSRPAIVRNAPLAKPARAESVDSACSTWSTLRRVRRPACAAIGAAAGLAAPDRRLRRTLAAAPMTARRGRREARRRCHMCQLGGERRRDRRYRVGPAAPGQHQVRVGVAH